MSIAPVIVVLPETTRSPAIVTTSLLTVSLIAPAATFIPPLATKIPQELELTTLNPPLEIVTVFPTETFPTMLADTLLFAEVITRLLLPVMLTLPDAVTELANEDEPVTSRPFLTLKF